MFHRRPARRPTPGTGFADESRCDRIDQGVGEFVDDIGAGGELDLAQAARREHGFAALPILIEAAREMRVEMMREVRDAAVRVEYDDVVVVRHDDEADDFDAAGRGGVGQRIEKQGDRLLVGLEQKLPHGAPAREEIVHAWYGKAWSHRRC